MANLTPIQMGCVAAATIVILLLAWNIWCASRAQSFQCGCGAVMSTAAPTVENIVVAPPSTLNPDMLPTEEQYQGTGGCGCGGH